MRRLSCLLSIIFVSVVSFALALRAQETKDQDPVKLVSSVQPAVALDPSLNNEVAAAVDRALAWLASQQKEDGSWSDANFPALTALGMQSFINSHYPDRKQIIDKAAEYILSCVQTNGGIYREVPGRKGGGLSNYNTAICMTALHATGDPAFTKAVQDARRFVAGSQYTGDDVYEGGFGYDRETQRTYTDLLNTYYVTEAMTKTADVEDKRAKGETRVDIDWDKTVKYIETMQNKPGSGREESGGFFYNPTDPKAGAVTNADKVVVLRSFGSMTYAGMLALIHAKVGRDDVRVRSALDWASRHWTLEENPGMGQQGLFFFYNILSKALAASGQNVIQATDNKAINWRSELAAKLVSTQTIEQTSGKGYWKNGNNRFWEDNAVLVTAYSIIALQNL